MDFSFIEFRNFGFNATTISFFGTLGTSFVQAWFGLRKQYQRIGVMKSGKSIPMEMYAYFTVYFFTFGIYGIRTHSLAMIINGLMGIMYFLVYLRAGRCPDSSGRKVWHYFLLLFIPLMMWVKNPQILLAVSLAGASMLIVQSPLEIWRKKDVGSVEPRFCITFIISALFWTIYSAAIRDWPIKSPSQVSLALW